MIKRKNIETNRLDKENIIGQEVVRDSKEERME